MIQRPPTQDALLAGALAALVLGENLVFGAPWVAVLLSVLPAVLLAWRRGLPLLTPTAIIVIAGYVVNGADADVFESVGQLLVWVVGAYFGGAQESTRTKWIALGYWWAVAALWAWATSVSLNDAVFELVLVTAPWIAGAVTATHRQRADRADLEATEERMRASIAVSGERTKIARELHDVVAHALAIMVVQAGGAQQLVTRNPAKAYEALEAVQESGRTAVAELGRMLGLLRTSGSDERDPLPSLAHVEDLAEGARAAGTPVTLEMDDAGGLPPALDATAYRIVQESLTNAVKHAPRQPVTVALRHDAELVRIEVTNPLGTRRASTAGTGHGLLGMRERADAFGGTLDHRVTGDRNFELRVTLHVEPTRDESLP